MEPAFLFVFLFFFSSRRRHTRFDCDWSSDVCSSDLRVLEFIGRYATPPERMLLDYDPVGGYRLVESGYRPPRPATQAELDADKLLGRSEERRGGKEGRSRGAPDH